MSHTPAAVSPLGSPRVHLRRTSSTNDRARELALAGAPSGTVVTASEQTAGRGRQGRRWSAPPGSALLMSLLLRFPAGAGAPPLLPLIAAVAVCDAVGAGTQIKWPNDIVVEQDTGSEGWGLAKLAGILVEGRPYPEGHRQERWAVVGIGLNVAVSLGELRVERSALPPATMGLSPAQIEPVLARVLEAMERRLAEPAQETLRAWRGRDALRGREVAWAGGHGRAEGIDGTGRLVVALKDGGRTALAAGEVHLRTPS